MVRTMAACLAQKGVPETLERKILAFAAPTHLCSRMEQGEAPPQVEIAQQGLGEKPVRAAVAFCGGAGGGRGGVSGPASGGVLGFAGLSDAPVGG